MKRRRYLSEHAKTDIADAQILATMPSFGGPRLDPVHIPAARSHALQRLTKQRSCFQDDISAAKRRLLDLVRWASPGLEAVLPDLATHLSLALLQRWLDPAAVLSARRPTLRKFVAEHASGNHPHSGPFVETLIDGLRHASQQARDLHGRHVDFAELQAEVTLEIDIMLGKMAATSRSSVVSQRFMKNWIRNHCLKAFQASAGTWLQQSWACFTLPDASTLSDTCAGSVGSSLNDPIVAGPSAQGSRSPKAEMIESNAR